MKHTKRTVGILLGVILVTTVSFFILSRDASAPDSQQKPTKLVAPEVTPVSTSRVAIQDYQLIPQSIVIEKGRTVIWTNADSISQEIIFAFKSGDQTSGILAPGASYSRSFDKTGTVLYMLRSNPDAVGAITISP